MRSEEFKDHVNKHIISALSGYILHLECEQFLWLLDSLCHQSKIQTPNLAPVSLMRFFCRASVHSDTYCVLLPHHHHNASLTWNFPCSYIPYASRLLSYISSSPLSKLLYLSSNHLCYIYKLSWLSPSLTSQALLIALCSGL